MAKYKTPPGVTKQTAEFLKKVASLNLPPTLTLTPAQAREQVEQGVAARELSLIHISEPTRPY